MKKILFLLVGVSICLIGSVSYADSARTIKFKNGVALGANTLITGNGGTLYRVSGRATSANAFYVLYDAATVVAAAETSPTSNILAEGGEATQYDSIPTLDFGEDGLPFSSGLVVVTSTADIAVLYR